MSGIPMIDVLPPKDATGQKMQREFQRIQAEFNAANPSQRALVISDGFEYAIRLDGVYYVYEFYHGSDGVEYDMYRPANKFETHILAKVESLLRFFVE